MPLARPLVAHGRLRGYGHVHGNDERVRSLWEAFFALAAPRNVTMGDPTEREWLEGLRYEDKFPDVEEVEAERDAAVARAERAEALLERLARVATQELRHRYMGGCPDYTQPKSRDPLCAACQVLAAVREHTDSDRSS